MRLLAYTFLAIRCLRAHMLRSFLAVLGIVIGVGAVLIVVSVAEGARSEVSKQINSLGSNLLLVRPGAQLDQGVRQQVGSTLTLTAADARALAREIPTVLVAAPFVGEQLSAVVGNLNWSTLVAGVTVDYLEAREWKLSNGQWFSDEHLASAAKVAVVGNTIARELFSGEDAIGRLLRIGRTSYAVIGVLAEEGQDFTGCDQDDVIFIPLTSARIFAIGRSQANPDAVHSILVKFDSAASMAEASMSISPVLRQRHKIVGRKQDDFQIQNLVQIVQARDAAYRQFTLLVSMLAAISLFVGGIGIMNIMLVSVTERTLEIGIRLAVGAKQRDILWQFLVEALTLSFSGGVVGIALGLAGSQLVSTTAGWPLLISWSAISLAV